MAKKKNRPPIEQLREAGKIAHEMLIKKGILAEKSIIDAILKDPNAPMLPGIPSYLPYPWTIKTSQRIMRDILIMWKEETCGHLKRRENITEFWKFLRKTLHIKEEQYKREMENMPKIFKSLKNIPVIKEIFSPLEKKEKIEGIHLFMIHSFQVAISLERYTNTSDYANWFLDWTESLYKLWFKPEKEKEI